MKEDCVARNAKSKKEGHFLYVSLFSGWKKATFIWDVINEGGRIGTLSLYYTKASWGPRE